MGRSGTVARVSDVPSRRALLGGALALAFTAVAGCTSDDPAPGRRTLTLGPTPGRAEEDISLVVRAIRDEERLLAYCTAMGRRHPTMRPLTRSLAARQRAHVERLREILTDDDPDPVGTSWRVPRNTPAAVDKLAAQLATARDARLDDCLAATSGLLAGTFASISASHACTHHTVVGPT